MNQKTASAEIKDENPSRDGQRAARPFITISRQPGVMSPTLLDKLVRALCAADHEHAECWHGYDHELIEKVARLNHLSKPLVASLGQRKHSWVEDLFAGMSASFDGSTEATTYYRVARYIRTLAQQGYAVIVGRGGAFITDPMPGGVHVSLVAPDEHRINTLVRKRDVSQKQAAHLMHSLDEARASFYHRYGYHSPSDLELYHATFNTAETDEDTLVRGIVDLVSGPQHRRHRAEHHA